MKVAILGTTGDAGMVLLRILADHPEVGEILPVSSSQSGESLSHSDPGLGGAAARKTEISGGRLLTVEEALAAKPEVVFSCLPHLASAKVLAPFFGKALVIDLSADFRIADAGVFAKAYGEEPPRKDLLPRAVYGLCEIHREAIRKSDLIASPGCYPTSALLPTVPLARSGLLTGKVFWNSLSGNSGAGKKVAANYLFVERDESCGAYNPGKTHRHTSEIQFELAKADPGLDLYFTPHLVPLKRGIATTIIAETARALSDEEIRTVYADAYADCPFVRIVEGRIPETHDVLGSNRCDIAFHREGSTLFLFSALDNLVKGASGQAVQSMNIRLGMPESAGLRVYGEL